MGEISVPAHFDQYIESLYADVVSRNEMGHSSHNSGNWSDIKVVMSFFLEVLVGDGDRNRQGPLVRALLHVKWASLLQKAGKYDRAEERFGKRGVLENP